MGMTFSSLDEIANDNKDSIDCHYNVKFENNHEYFTLAVNRTRVSMLEPVKLKVKGNMNTTSTRHWKSHYNVEVRHAPFAEGDRVVISVDDSDQDDKKLFSLSGKKGTVDVLLKNGTVIVELDETKQRVEVNVENLDHVFKRESEPQKVVEAVISVWRTKGSCSTPGASRRYLPSRCWLSLDVGVSAEFQKKKKHNSTILQ